MKEVQTNVSNTDRLIPSMYVRAFCYKKSANKREKYRQVDT